MAPAASEGGGADYGGLKADYGRLWLRLPLKVGVLTMADYGLIQVLTSLVDTITTDTWSLGVMLLIYIFLCEKKTLSP